MSGQYKNKTGHITETRQYTDEFLAGALRILQLTPRLTRRGLPRGLPLSPALDSTVPEKEKHIKYMALITHPADLTHTGTSKSAQRLLLQR